MAILKKTILFLLPAPFLLTGCYETFEPDADAEPVLCINSIITAGEPFTVAVSHTWRYDLKSSSSDRDVKDAAIAIYANDRLVGHDYLPAEGDRLRIVATSPTYGRAEAEVTVPESPSVKSLKFTPTLLSRWSDPAEDVAMRGGADMNLLVEMEVEDKLPDQTGFYQLCFGPYFNVGDGELIYPAPSDRNFGNISGGPVSFSIGTFYYETEPIFTEHVGEFDSMMGADTEGFAFFSDRQFTGKSYTLHLQFSNVSYSVNSTEYNPDLYDCGVNITLYALSPSLYNWAMYAWQIGYGTIGDLADLGLSDQMWAYSNVSTGAGLVVARTKVIYTVNLKDFIQHALMQK